MRVLCPEAKAPGKRVKGVTVERMVLPDLREEVEKQEWYFCEEPDCEVVYFAEDGTAFYRSDVTVGVKEDDPPHTVCYCFAHSVESIADEVERTGQSTVVESVTAKVKAGECSCEGLNPKGACCLGDLRAAVKDALGEAASQTSDGGCETSCCEES